MQAAQVHSHAEEEEEEEDDEECLSAIVRSIWRERADPRLDWVESDPKR